MISNEQIRGDNSSSSRAQGDSKIHRKEMVSGTLSTHLGDITQHLHDAKTHFLFLCKKETSRHTCYGIASSSTVASKKRIGQVTFGHSGHERQLRLSPSPGCALLGPVAGSQEL